MSEFSRDVAEGLSATPKRLSSKYFYDEIGDKIFQQIMEMPEYYLTDAEAEIFELHATDIVESWEMSQDESFDIVELGAGDGSKTKVLLNKLLDLSYEFRYLPIDISQNALDGLAQSLSRELPALKVKTLQGEYFSVLSDLAANDRPKVVLFLGSNLGNMPDELASSFLSELSNCLRVNDKVLLGLDQIKSDDIVLKAYDDPAGITASFNLNLLNRINRELGANFKIDAFRHLAKYDESEGIARSYLESLESQSVTIESLQKTYHFERGERIDVEISRKYTDEILTSVISSSDLELIHKFLDSRAYFADYLLVKR